MEAVLIAEQGGHGACIAEATYRQVQRRSVAKQLHPLGEGPFGPQPRYRPRYIGTAMHRGRRLAGPPNGPRLYTG